MFRALPITGSVERAGIEAHGAAAVPVKVPVNTADRACSTGEVRLGTTAGASMVNPP